MCNLKKELARFRNIHKLDGKVHRNDNYMISSFEEIVENSYSDLETEKVSVHTKYYIFESILSYTIIGILIFILSNIFLGSSAINNPSNIHLKYIIKILLVIMIVITTIFAFFPHKTIIRSMTTSLFIMFFSNAIIILIISSFFVYLSLIQQ